MVGRCVINSQKGEKVDFHFPIGALVFFSFNGFLFFFLKVGGEMQNIVYGEFLPTILGKKYMHKYNLLAEDTSKVMHVSNLLMLCRHPSI